MIVPGKKKYGYNPKPRLSANQLAEYLNATPTRRKGIIRDAKFPRQVVTARYDTAKEAVNKYLTDSTRSVQILNDIVIELGKAGNDPKASAWKKDNCLRSIEAIATFQKSANKLGLNAFSFRLPPATKTVLDIYGVRISVAMDLIAYKSNKHGHQSIGGVLLLVAKSDASSKNRAARCEAAAVLTMLATEEHLSALGEIDPKLCMAVDVFGGTVYPAKGNYKRLNGSIESSCEEIAQRWPSIEPPADYDGSHFD